MIAPLAQPLYFGPTERALFGWLHQPSSQDAAPLGVVICNPFGYEALCTHRTLRHLAIRVAAAGFPVLRFDYDGTGDSAGDDYDSDRLHTWLASIAAAIDTIKNEAGVSRVCLIGLRLGAMLATLVAQKREDVAGLIAVAPVIKGRAYLRELRALALARPQAPPPVGAKAPTDIQEAAGFFFTPQTQTALADIDLMQIAARPAPQILLLDRDDLPYNIAWSEHLQTLGAAVASQTFRGYAAMTISAHESVVPPMLLDAAVRWVEALEPARAPAASIDAGGKSSFADGAVRESILFPNTQTGLFGILTEPAATATGTLPQDIVLLLNAGAISRVGPGRLYVTLARHLARQGIVVFRMDISGIGDSRAPAGASENSVYASWAGENIDATLTCLRQRFGATRYHAVGLCSGAYHGFKAAVAGLPFDTAVAINPLTFFWKEGMSLAEPEFHIAAESARYQSSALRFASWLKLLRGQVNVRTLSSIILRRAVQTMTHAAREGARRLHIRLQDDLAAELHQAVGDSRRLLFIFASADPGLQLLREQGGSAVEQLRRRGQLKLEIVEGADHTFTPHWSRDQLVELLTTHLHQAAQ